MTSYCCYTHTWLRYVYSFEVLLFHKANAFCIYFPFLTAENRGISILIGAIINTTLLVILYWSIRLCCPTCCRKIRQGIVFNIADIQVPEVQPLGYNISGRRFDVENKY